MNRIDLGSERGRSLSLHLNWRGFLATPWPSPQAATIAMLLAARLNPSIAGLPRIQSLTARIISDTFLCHE
jgi:hypothetical protein